MNVFDGPFINTDLYSTWELIWYFGGWILWIPVYAVVIKRIYVNKYLEIPVVAATGNIAWEFLWGFVYEVDMGWGLQLIYMGAFIMDGFILYGVFRYGAKQVWSAAVRAYWPLTCIFLLAVWTAFYIGFDQQGDDLPLGSVTAYTVNLVMSISYLYFGVSRADPREMSLVAAWFKFLGTGGVTVFVFLRYDHALVETLAVMVTILDIAYIALLTYRLRNYDPDEVIDRRDRDGYVEIDLRDIEAAGSSAVAPGPRTATDGVN